MEMDTDKVPAVSVPIGIKKIDIFARLGQILAGGCILFFSMEYVKYRKVTKCKSVIQLLIDQNRLQPCFGTFPEGVDHCSRGVEPFQPPAPDNFCPCMFPLCVFAREHALGRVSVIFYASVYVRDRVHDLVCCGVGVNGRVRILDSAHDSARYRCCFRANVSGRDRDRCGLRVCGRHGDFDRVCDSACVGLCPLLFPCQFVSVTEYEFVSMHVQCP